MNDAFCDNRKKFVKPAGFLLAGFVALSPALSARGQASFANLDFESAMTNPVPGSPYYPYAVYTAKAVPGWSVYYGTSQQTWITYDAISTGGTAVTLVGTNDHYGPNAIEGSFGVLLQGGSTAPDASIRQTGLVPLTAESIQFKATSMGPIFLTLGGLSIAFR